MEEREYRAKHSGLVNNRINWIFSQVKSVLNQVVHPILGMGQFKELLLFDTVSTNHRPLQCC